MTSIAAIEAASGAYATAWREFATASRDVAHRKQSLGTLIAKGLPGDSTAFDDTVQAVGRLKGTRDALDTSTTALVDALKGADDIADKMPDSAAQSFRASVAELRSDVALPAATIPWKATPFSHSTRADKSALGILGGMVGGLGSLVTGAILDPNLAVQGSEIAIMAAPTAIGAASPGLIRTKRGGSAFAYVDAVAKLTSDSVGGKPSGDKVQLKKLGVDSRKRVKVPQLMEGLDTLARNAEGRAGTAEREAADVQRLLGSIRAPQASTTNRLNSLLEKSRAEASESVERSQQMEDQLGRELDLV